MIMIMMIFIKFSISRKFNYEQIQNMCMHDS
jgi:hypothetical protein